jgi:hypothetical protein
MSEHFKFWLTVVSGLSICLFILFFVFNFIVAFVVSRLGRSEICIGKFGYLLPILQVLLFFASYLALDSNLNQFDAAYSGIAAFVAIAVVLALIWLLLGVIFTTIRQIILNKSKRRASETGAHV